MQKKQVAVIDVGSSKITAVLGERGINKTFVIKGTFTYEYDGYSEGVFFDDERLKRILFSAGEDLKRASHGSVNCVYIGVPGEFTQVMVKESQISFAKKKKIQDQDVDALFDSAFMQTSSKQTLINRSAVYFELDDFRRMADPVGAVSEILKGKLSFITCTNYFIDTISPAFKALGFSTVECVSSTLAEALYLFAPEERDRVALLTDVGYISTTVAIIHGDGVLFQKTFPYGGGYITAAIVERFGLDFDPAENLKKKVNMSQRISSTSSDLIECEDGKYYPLQEIQKVMLESLDEFCETVSSTLDNSGYKIPEYVPLSITGGGIAYIRGAKEHVSGRIGMVVDVKSPKVPLMDKPTQSNILSLLDLALGQN